METWLKLSLVICIFGFFKEFRPSEPFITDYLIDYKNYTEDQVVHIAYPVGTYSYLATLPIIFLITDLFRYKSIIILEGLAFIACYILLIWGNGVTILVIAELFYGLANSTEIAYYTYIFAKVDRDKFKRVTSFNYVAILLGNFAAAGLSQIFYSADILDLRGLHYLTLGSVSIATLISFFLPSVQHSIYFHSNSNEPTAADADSQIKNEIESKWTKKYLGKVFGTLWLDFKAAYSSTYVLKWSIWWAISSAGFLQVINYTQALWKVVKNDEESESYNGAVDAIHTILSAVFTLLFGYLSVPWNKWGESFLCLMSILQGGLLLWMSQTNSIFVAYASYIVFRTLYQVMISVATAEVAGKITENSYGLIFGVNRFFALAIQTIITLIVTDENGLALDERTQFLVYGSYFEILGILFAFGSIYTFIHNHNRRKGQT